MILLTTRCNSQNSKACNRPDAFSAIERCSGSETCAYFCMGLGLGMGLGLESPALERNYGFCRDARDCTHPRQQCIPAQCKRGFRKILI